MATPIRQLPTNLLLVPIGGRFEDGQYIFKENRTDFHKCRLIYKPDYFFHHYGDDNDNLVHIIKEKFNQFSSFPWDKLFTLDINQRIELQKMFFDILNELSVQNIRTTSTSIQEYHVKAKTKLLEAMNKYRSLFDKQPGLISYQRKHGDKNLYFVWLMVKVYDYQLPELNASQRFNELFYLLNHFYSTDRIDPRIRLSIDYNDLIINTTNFTSVAISNPNEDNLQIYKEIIIQKNNKFFYPTQEEVGKDLFKIIINRIPDFETRYDRFEVYLLLPPRNSLRTQSSVRMQDCLTKLEKDYLNIPDNVDTEKHPRIYLINPTNKSNYETNVIKKAMNPNNKKTMFLIIQDECHWGMNIDSQADKYFVNSDTLLDKNQLDNIYFLQVSATPYNIEAIEDFRRENIIRWDDSVKNLPPTNYQGRIELIQNNKIRCQSIQSKKLMSNFKNYYSTLAYLSANQVDGRFSLPELSIFCEYFVTLHYLLVSRINQRYENLFDEKLKQFVTDETKEILQGLFDVDTNGKGYLAVLRLKYTETAQQLKKSLQKLLEIYKQSDLFDIVVDVDDDKICLFDRLSNKSQEKYKRWWKLDQLTEKDRKNFGYENLKYLPLLLIVIEKGRMGDTFPSESFRYFDLRARYQGSTLYSTYYCSLLQDVGRSFGYPTSNFGRPIVFMGEEIFQLLHQNTLKPHETLKRTNNAKPNIDPLTAGTTYVDLDKHWMLNKDHPFGPDAKPSRREAHKNVAYRRFLLSAHPQIGKTNSFIWAVHLFLEHFTKPKLQPSQITQDPDPDSYYNILYKFRGQDSNKLHINLNNDEKVSNQWDQFHRHAQGIYHVWKEEPDEIVPFEHSIKIIQDSMKKLSTNDQVIIIDMGCGLAKLAQYFQTQDKVKVISIDHKRHSLVPDDISVLEMNMNKITLSDIGNRLGHFVVFSLSLWGTQENITSYIQTAIDLLELNGRMIIIDAKNNQIDHANLKNYVITMLNKTKKLLYKISPERPKSRFFCIVAKREEEEEF